MEFDSWFMEHLQNLMGDLKKIKKLVKLEMYTEIIWTILFQYLFFCLCKHRSYENGKCKNI